MNSSVLSLTSSESSSLNKCLLELKLRQKRQLEQQHQQQQQNNSYYYEGIILNYLVFDLFEFMLRFVDNLLNVQFMTS